MFFSLLIRQKRSRKADDKTSLPPWVVCTNSFELWLKDTELPVQLQLTSAAATQIKNIREWAALERAEAEAEEEAEEELVPQSPEDLAGAMGGGWVPLPVPKPVIPTVFDPAVLARVATIKATV